MKLMELYKTEKVNPMGSCGFLLIQMPILLVIYNIILSIKDPSNFFHIYDFQSSFDISSINFSFFGMDLLQSG
jgi:membrane protein insertase Oxa1/YidC/SpoIIIJ